MELTLPDLMTQLLARRKIVATEEAHCGIHGRYLANKSAGGRVSPCPLCQEAEKAKEAARLAQQAQQRLAQTIGKCGIPKRHQHCRVASYLATTPKQKMLKEAITHYAQEMLSGGLKRNFVLLGNCGTGKTHLACAVGLEAIRHGKTVLFLTASEIIRRVQATHKSTTETEWDLMHAFSNLDLLIVDEVGVQYGSDSANRIITEMVNARYNNELPTIFISNLDKQAFQDLMGERAMSRMKEDGCVPFVCDWSDYRTNKPGERR